MRDRLLKERLYPVLLFDHRRSGLVLTAHGHGEQVLHLQHSEVLTSRFWQILWEQRGDMIVHSQPAFRNGETDGSGGEALAHRVHAVLERRSIGRPPAFGHHSAVAQHHEAVQLMLAVRDGIKKSEDAGG